MVNKFLIDSGSRYSCIVPCEEDYLHKDTLHLTAANGSLIPTYGKRTISFQLGSLTFCHTFIIAEVSMNILWLDFFQSSGKHYLIDIAKGCLCHRYSGRCIPADKIISARKTVHSITDSLDSNARLLLEKYPDIISKTLKETPAFGRTFENSY